MASSILNSDDGVVSGTSGLKTSGGDNGELKIQTNGTDVLTLKPTKSVNFIPTTEPTSPSAGDVYYSSSTNKLRCYDGTSWQDCF